jgi:hypothetical protein
MLSHGRGSLQVSSKFIACYTKLLQGHPLHLISPNESPTEFWTTLLTLDVDREWLTARLSQVSKEDYMGKLKVRTIGQHLGSTSGPWLVQ